MYSKLIDYLNNLETPDIIADFLERMGITGVMKDGDSCVITRWLLEFTENNSMDVLTEENSITIIGEGYCTETFDVSPAVAQFIDAFDNGKYPTLIEDASPWL